MGVCSGSLGQPGTGVNLKGTLKVCDRISSAETDLGLSLRSATCWLGDPGQTTCPHTPRCSHLHHGGQRTRLKIETRMERGP